MPVLWLRFPDEALLFARFTNAEKKRLEDIFSATEAASAWNRALSLMRLSGPAEKLIFWHHDTPYFNGSAMAHVVSGGAVRAVKAVEGGYGFKVGHSFRDIWALLSSQWKITRFTQRLEKEDDDRLATSIALGVVLQSLVMRLGRDVERLPAWLAGVAPPPRRYRTIVRQLQEIQMRRTRLSPAWREIFPQRADDAAAYNGLPEYFWDAPATEAEPAGVEHSSCPEEWTGVSVCAGRVTGVAVLASSREAAHLAGFRKKYNAPVVLVFRHARPETTELFEYADALLFAEGGVLSHACTVARERNIPAVTGLGSVFFQDFTALAGEGEVLWFSVDAVTGVVKRTK